MKTRVAMAVVLVCSGTLRADFSFESQTQVTGGALLQTVLAADPRARTSKPVVALYLIKGNRMATVTKERTTVVNLDNDTIMVIDFVKKTYISKPLAETKKMIDDAMKKGGGSPVAFQVASKSGRSKDMGVLRARERVITMTNDSAPVAHISLDCWDLSVPLFGDVEDFRGKLAAKLGNAYALGISDIGIAKPELLPAFEELAKVLIQGGAMPVGITIRMGGPASGDLAPNDNVASQKSGVVADAVGRIENLGRKPVAPTDDAAYPDMLAEVTIELSNFSSGAAEESKFNPPEGFKNLNPPAPKPAAPKP
jgi:hypothetical protein